MTIKVEANIPMPRKPAARGESKYPFTKMKVGDSFVVELGGHASWAFIFNAIQNAQKEHKIQLTTRLVEDRKRRIWRTA